VPRARRAVVARVRGLLWPTAADVVKRKSIKTLNGQRVRVRVRGGRVFVGGARVTTPDVAASNAVIRRDVAAYLSDFSMTREWDPGVVAAQRLDDRPVALGSRFRIVARFLGRRAELTYEIIRHDVDELVTLRGENATVSRSTRCASADTPEAGTRAIYEADLTLKGPLRVLDPALGLAFDRVGERAAAGLRARLERRPAGAPA
jgi:Polyketide cyclase / dehydrase and lipid transport/Fasciclin domain